MGWLLRLNRAARSILHLNRPREVRWLWRALALADGQRLLDVGCGDGFWSAWFARRASRVVGLDPDAAMLQLGRRLHGRPNLYYVQGQAEQLPLADATMDGVVAVSVLEHFADAGAGLKELARVLRPGGRLALSADSLHEQNSPAWFRHWHRNRYHVVTYFDETSLRRLLAEAGLEVEGLVAGIHCSRFAAAVRRFYMRHKPWAFVLFPIFWLSCRLADRWGWGGRIAPQILLVKARKP